MLKSEIAEVHNIARKIAQEEVAKVVAKIEAQFKERKAIQKSKGVAANAKLQ